MNLWKRPKGNRTAVQTAAPRQEVEELCLGESQLYSQLRGTIPVIDAAIRHLLRLTGTFQLSCEDPAERRELERFVREVPVGANQYGLQEFMVHYLDSLLTYGTAVGEMVLDGRRTGVAALYHPPLDHLEIRPGETPLEAVVLVRQNGWEAQPVRWPQLVFFSALDPAPGQVKGRSLLEGLPFVSSVLVKIYRSMGQNFERAGNVRYAVTYRPGPGEAGNARQIAKEMADQWSQAMSDTRDGRVKDFVAVGDVGIRVIGAESRMPDTQIPVRQMLEEIVAKLGIPPFLLGLNWSTTERMSRQQADFLTSELDSYRRLMEPVLRKICRTHLRLKGFDGEIQIAWDNVSLQDEVDMAAARLDNARAAQIEEKLAQPAGGKERP